MAFVQVLKLNVGSLEQYFLKSQKIHNGSNSKISHANQI